jgi:hypothetical protein
MAKSKIAIDSDSAASRRSKKAVADPRAALAAQFIPAGARVLELGGAASVKRHLPSGCTHEARTLGGFPGAGNPDIVVMLDALDGAASCDAVFAPAARLQRPVILNYRPRDLDDSGRSNARLSFYDLARLFDRHDLRIECNVPMGPGEVLLRLAPAEKLASPPPCSIAVISTGETAHAGLQMIAGVLPPEADIHHLTFDTLNEARPRYDLVVVGTGAGLSPAMLTDALIDAVKCGASAIGIFGTQYRELITRPALDRLLDNLDIWFARNEDDLLLYGRGRPNVVHLGEWTVDAAPLSQGRDTITTVEATDLASLAAALANADIVRYRSGEQLDAAEARSLLVDVFGRGYPPGDGFLVERDAVLRYKVRVRANIEALKDRIAAILRKSAVAAAA